MIVLMSSTNFICQPQYGNNVEFYGL